MAKPAGLKFSQFIDLLLARLYDLEQDAGPSALFDVNAIAQELRIKVPSQWVFDAGKVMESRGWAQVLFTFGGGCHARLTGEGRLYVEEERGTGMIKAYRETPQHFVVVSGVGNQVVVSGSTGALSQAATLEQERAPAFHILDQLKLTLQRDPSLSDAERQDLLADAEMIERQLKKREPNRAALAALLDSLSRVASIGASVADLVRLFNP